MILRDKNSILEAIRGGRGFSVIKFMAPPDRDEKLREIAEEASRRRIRTMNIRAKDAKVRTERESGVEAECNDFEYSSISGIIEASKKLGRAAQVVALDHVQDPRNLGAIIRSAAAAGASGLIIENKRCCPVTAVAYETSSGGAEKIPVTSVPNLSSALNELKDNDFWVAGADERAGKTAFEHDLNIPLVWVLGTEGKGMGRLIRESCDFLVKIPTRKEFPSLNVSVAAGILLFEALRQKQFSYK